MPRLDYLVNNSGAGSMAPLMGVDTDEAKNMFDVNTFALVTVTQAFLPMLIEAKDDVVNNSSLAGCPGWTVAFQGTYNMSKHTANSISDGMRVELAPFGVRVVNVVAGSIRSKFWENVAIPTIKEGSLYASVKKKAEGEYVGGIGVDVHGCGMCMRGRW